MAEGTDGGGIWLPSEFLVDDFAKEGDRKSSGEATAVGGSLFPCESFDFGSDTNSPVEHATETESGEEEYLAGLTRQMAHSFLQDDEDDFSVLAENKLQSPKVMATSPQSTLCAFGIWLDSGRTSPNSSSHFSSPPSTPVDKQKDDSWDMLYMAAGQVARLRNNDQPEEAKTSGRGLLCPPKNISIATNPKSPTAGFKGSPVPSQKQIRIEQPKQQRRQLMKQQSSSAWGSQSKARSSDGYGDWRRGHPLGLPSSAWPPLQPQQQQQPQAGYGMRAVFLSSPGARRASSGTGVFLPQRAGNHTETRKKPACSAVLVPARVVQALNLNVDDMGAHPHFPGTFVLGHDALLARKNSVLTKQKRRVQSTTSASEEIHLPAEWTY